MIETLRSLSKDQIIKIGAAYEKGGTFTNRKARDEAYAFLIRSDLHRGYGDLEMKAMNALYDGEKIRNGEGVDYMLKAWLVQACAGFTLGLFAYGRISDAEYIGLVAPFSLVFPWALDPTLTHEFIHEQLMELQDAPVGASKRERHMQDDIDRKKKTKKKDEHAELMSMAEEVPAPEIKDRALAAQLEQALLKVQGPQEPEFVLEGLF